jgi:regulatory protein
MPARSADKLLLAARKFCFRLLKARQRTKFEITKRLEEKQYTASIITTVLQDLVNAKLIDDQKFARDWADQRLHNGYGTSRIKLELKEKGVDEALIEQALKGAEITDERQSAIHQAQKRAKLYRGLEPAIIQRRLYGFLIGKGFSDDIVQDIVNHYDDQRNS